MTTSMLLFTLRNVEVVKEIVLFVFSQFTFLSISGLNLYPDVLKLLDIVDHWDHYVLIE